MRLSQQLRMTLEHEILTGLMAPGARLDEVGLAKRFSVSRTPVREALAQLGALGLVEMRPRQGAIVRRISVRGLVEMFETMAELEAACARLAARRMTDADRTSILDAHEACRNAAEPADPDAYYVENARFHAAIHAAARNDFLKDETERLYDRLDPYRRVQLSNRGRPKASFAEHDAIVAALSAGDETEAAARMRAHVGMIGDTFSDFISALPEGLMQA